MLTALYELEVLKFIDFFSILSSSNMAHGREKYYNNNFLSKKIFQKIKEALRSLDYDSYQVWEEVTQYSNYRKQKLFRRDVLTDQMIRIIMPYLKKIYIPRASSTSWNHFDARTDRILVYTKLH